MQITLMEIDIKLNKNPLAGQLSIIFVFIYIYLLYMDMCNMLQTITTYIHFQ